MYRTTIPRCTTTASLILDKACTPIFALASQLTRLWATGQWVGQQPTVDVMTPIALRPPEIVIGSDFGPRVDIWALGCLTFELLVGERLFNTVANGDKWTVEEDLLAQILAITGQRFSPAALGDWVVHNGVTAFWMETVRLYRSSGVDTLTRLRKYLAKGAAPSDFIRRTSGEQRFPATE